MSKAKVIFELTSEAIELIAQGPQHHPNRHPGISEKQSKVSEE
jgi:hypothetical protein